MTFIDTHSHLHFDAFDGDRAAVVQRSLAAGVRYLVNVGTDFGTNAQAYELAGQYDFMFHTTGLHPHSAHLIDDEGLAQLESQIARQKPVAIGEIGLDYFKSEADHDTQKRIFRHMLHLADKFSLPVIVHSRNAFDDTYQILREAAGAGGRIPQRGVMHCFSYDEQAMKKIFDLGFLVSFTGNVTYKNALALLEVAKKAPLGRFFLETDSPYLAPQHVRGQRNEPAYLADSARFLAQSRGDDVEDLARATTETAAKFFKVAIP
jgi:TatD DNase family protein